MEVDAIVFFDVAPEQRRKVRALGRHLVHQLDELAPVRKLVLAARGGIGRAPFRDEVRERQRPPHEVVFVGGGVGQAEQQRAARSQHAQPLAQHRERLVGVLEHVERDEEVLALVGDARERLGVEQVGGLDQRLRVQARLARRLGPGQPIDIGDAHSLLHPRGVVLGADLQAPPAQVQRREVAPDAVLLRAGDLVHQPLEARERGQVGPEGLLPHRPLPSSFFSASMAACALGTSGTGGVPAGSNSRMLPLLIQSQNSCRRGSRS